MAKNREEPLIWFRGSKEFCKELIELLTKSEDVISNLGQLERIDIRETLDEEDILLYLIDTSQRGRSHRAIIYSRTPNAISANLLEEIPEYITIYANNERMFFNLFGALGAIALDRVKKTGDLRPEKVFYCFHYGFIIGFSIREYISRTGNEENEIVKFHELNYKEFPELKPDILRFIELYTIHKVSGLFSEPFLFGAPEAAKDFDKKIKEAIGKGLKNIFDKEKHVESLIQLYDASLPIYLLLE